MQHIKNLQNGKKYNFITQGNENIHTGDITKIHTAKILGELNTSSNSSWYFRIVFQKTLLKPIYFLSTFQWHPACAIRKFLPICEHFPGADFSLKKTVQRYLRLKSEEAGHLHMKCRIISSSSSYWLYIAATTTSIFSIGWSKEQCPIKKPYRVFVCPGSFHKDFRLPTGVQISLFGWMNPSDFNL